MNKITLFILIITTLIILTACQQETKIIECEETMFTNECNTKSCLLNECELNATRNCAPAILKLQKEETRIGITTIQEITTEIKGIENDACIIKHNMTNYETILEEHHTDKLRRAGVSEDSIQRQIERANEKAKQKIGRVGVCKYNMDELRTKVNFQGFYHPPLEYGEDHNCTGNLYENN